METQKYFILESKMNEAADKLQKMNKKAARLGTPELTMTKIGTKDIAFVGDEMATDAQKELQVPGLYFKRFVEIVVSGPTPAVNGYTFVAALQHMTDDSGDTVNVLKTIPSFSAQLPEKYRNISPENCDHCHKAIKTRKETFVLRNDATGEFVQVGRNCLADFLGGRDPMEALMALNSCLKLSDFDVGLGYGGDIRVPTETFMAAAAMFIRTQGWLSRSQAYQNDEAHRATANKALEYTTPPSKAAMSQWLAWHQACPVTEKDMELAEKVITEVVEMLEEKQNTSDYEHNLLVALKQPSLDKRLAGITASAIPFYNREMTKVIAAQKLANSKHFGGTGEKVDGLKVVVLGEKAFDGKFGTTFLYKFLTQEGNSCTWFASKKQGLEIGQECVISGTVKAHNEFNGVKETVLTRVYVK